MSDKILTLSDDNFENEVLKSDLPVLVDFWAEWCGPCKMIAPVLDDVANEYEGKLVVGKLNVDQDSVSPTKYGVRNIPTLLLFKNGELVSRKVGVQSKTQLKEFIDAQI